MQKTLAFSSTVFSEPSLLLVYYTHTHLTALFPGLPGWAGTRMVNRSGFYWSKRQWVAVASAGLYASLCTSLQTNNHASTPPLRFLQAGCPSCRPTNSVKALKAHKVQKITRKGTQLTTQKWANQYPGRRLAVKCQNVGHWGHRG